MKNKKIFKFLLKIMLLPIIGFIIFVTCLFVEYQQSMQKQFDQTVKVIQPVYTQLQEKYNHNIVLTEAQSMAMYYYTFKYRGDLKNKITTNQNLFAISCDIFSDIQNYILSNQNSDPNLNTRGYRISFNADEKYVDFWNNYRENNGKIEIQTNAAINLDSLLQIKNLHYLCINPVFYTKNELEKIKRWCEQNKIDIEYSEYLH